MGKYHTIPHNYSSQKKAGRVGLEKYSKAYKREAQTAFGGQYIYNTIYSNILSYLEKRATFKFHIQKMNKREGSNLTSGRQNFRKLSEVT